MTFEEIPDTHPLLSGTRVRGSCDQGEKKNHVDDLPSILVRQIRSSFLLGLGVFAFVAMSIARMNDAGFESNPQLHSGAENKVLSTGLKPPHIVLVTIDDLGWNDIGYQSDDIPDATPVMSQLARLGVRLTQYYGQEMCTPARASLLSGRWPSSVGFQDKQITQWSTAGLPLRVTTLPQRLKEVSRGQWQYVTYGFGKWNLGFCNESYLPWNRGFDKFTGYMSQGVDYYSYQAATYTVPGDATGEERALYDLLEGTHGGEWGPARQYQGNYSTLLYRELATGALKKHAATQRKAIDLRPLFLWVAFHAVHRDDSSTPPMDILNETQQAYLTMLGQLGGLPPNRLHNAELLMPVDDSIRAIVTDLNKYNMMQDTVLVIHSDNGGDACHAAGDSAPWGSNWPLRGRKMSYFEGGVRVPAFIYSPRLSQSVRGTVHDGLMHHVDWLATFVSMAKGEPFEAYREGDGLNMWPALNGLNGASERQELILDLPQNSSFRFEKASESATQRDLWHGVVAVRKGDLKLVYTASNETWFPSDISTDSCPRYALVSDCETNTALDASCTWENYLFNVSIAEGGDPTEHRNLYFDSAYAHELHQLKAHIETYVSVMPEFDDPYALHSAQKEAKSSAEIAFAAAGDWIVPYGCEAVY